MCCEVEMRQHLLVHQFDDLVGIAVLDVLVLADDFQDFVGNALDQRIRRLLGKAAVARNQAKNRVNSFFIMEQSKLSIIQPRRAAIKNLVTATLLVGIANIGVLVERTFLDNLVGRQQAGPDIDKRTPTRLLRTGTSVTVPDRVGEGIDGPANRYRAHCAAR
jgi:hypothetical protein